MAFKKSFAAILLFGIVLIVVLAAAGCVSTEQSDSADTLYLGNVITMDDKNPTAEAVAVKDGNILFVGSAADAERYCDGNTEIINYDDYSIYPGFLDSHMHVALAAMRQYGMVPLTPGVSLAENIKELEAYIKVHPGEKSYVGFGWIYSGENPTAAMIDAVCSDVPVILQSSDGHSAWVNSRYLEKLNYTSEYIKAMGSEQIYVDADGKPTGFLKEVPAIALGKELPFTVEQIKEFLLKWQEGVIESGYTAVCDAGVELLGDKIYQAYSELDKEGKLKLRIYGLSAVKDNVDNPEEEMARIADLAKKYNSEHFKVIGAKIFLDGVTETHTTWMLEPYADMPESTGVKRFSDVDKMADLITAANKYGLLVHAHVMGDGAVHTFADAVEKSVMETGNYDQRNAAAHLQYVSKEDIERFGKYGIVAVSGYLWSPRSPVADIEEKAVGHERFIAGYPAQSFIDAGAVVVGHSDSPMTPVVLVPLAVYAGIERNLPFAESSDIIGPQEKMSREDTLKTLTSNVAYMWHEEDRMGTLEPGKLANMAVLDVDFLKDDMDAVADAVLTENVATVIDGKVVYSSEPVKLTGAEAEELIDIIINMAEIWAQQEDSLAILENL